MTYHELNLEERITIRVGLLQSLSLREIARQISRSPSTVSREIRRNSDNNGAYTVSTAQVQMRTRRIVCRPKRKLLPDSELFDLVKEMLRAHYSPEQIAGNLRSMFPKLKDAYVSHETIYNAIYALPVGELRKELIHCLRHGKTTRRPRLGGVDRRNQIPDMVSIHVRPPEIEDRLVPGHWEGDLIKGKGNASAVGTLVERASGYVMLVKMNNATATAAVEGFSASLNRMPLSIRKSMTYDQGREMTRHAEITQKTGVAIYFCDPHSPWQRGSNENANGLIREFLPKGMDLSQVSRQQLTAIEHALNHRPRKVLDWDSPHDRMAKLLGTPVLRR